MAPQCKKKIEDLRFTPPFSLKIKGIKLDKWRSFFTQVEKVSHFIDQSDILLPKQSENAPVFIFSKANYILITRSREVANYISKKVIARPLGIFEEKVTQDYTQQNNLFSWFRQPYFL